jgi:hypothetical protein
MQNRFGRLRSALTQSVRRAWAAPYTSRSYHPPVLAKRHQGQAAAAVRWREPTHESGLFENFVEEAHLICSGSIDRRRSRGPRTHTLSDVARRRPISSYSTKAGISSWPSVLARKVRPWTASAACDLRCGLQMPPVLRWSAISIHGTPPIVSPVITGHGERCEKAHFQPQRIAAIFTLVGSQS